MGFKRSFALLCAALLLSGCVNSTVREWALLGAASGAAAGAGVGALISDEKLLGSPATEETGDVSVQPSSGIIGGLIVGAVFGAVIGSMIGHHRHDPVEEAYEAQKAANVNLDSGGGSDGEISDEDLGVDLGDLEGLEDDEEESADDEEALDEEPAETDESDTEEPVEDDSSGDDGLGDDSEL